MIPAVGSPFFCKSNCGAPVPCPTCSYVIAIIFNDPPDPAIPDYALNMTDSSNPFLGYFLLNDTLSGGCGNRVYLIGNTLTYCSTILTALETAFGPSCVDSTTYDDRFVNDFYFNCDNVGYPSGGIDYGEGSGGGYREMIISDLAGVTALGSISYRIYRTCASSSSCVQVQSGNFTPIPGTNWQSTSGCIRQNCCTCQPPCEGPPPAKVRITFLDNGGMSAFQVGDGTGPPAGAMFDGFFLIRHVQVNTCGDNFWSWIWRAADGADGVVFYECDPTAIPPVNCRRFNLLQSYDYGIGGGEVSLTGIHYYCCDGDKYRWYFGRRDYNPGTGGPPDTGGLQPLELLTWFSSCFWRVFDYQNPANGTPYPDFICGNDPGNLMPVTGFACSPFYLEMTFSYTYGAFECGGEGRPDLDGTTISFKMIVTEEP